MAVVLVDGSLLHVGLLSTMSHIIACWSRLTSQVTKLLRHLTQMARLLQFFQGSNSQLLTRLTSDALLPSFIAASHLFVTSCLAKRAQT